ncbi:hypothetical protein [Nocardia brasiliensis]|uniref:hypothetical protein n=1 Tax=Nocardia brasiliensis TaxID=37326 RepID=UPI002454BE3B|nr:hypothetical protein [Nocardia brasiliensis]
MTAELSRATEAAEWSARVGFSLPDDRRAEVSATLDHILSVVGLLRELDFTDTAPATVFLAGGRDATV